MRYIVHRIVLPNGVISYSSMHVKVNDGEVDNKARTSMSSGAYFQHSLAGFVVRYTTAARHYGNMMV